MEATRDIFLNEIIQYKTANQSNTIIIKPPNTECAPKKTTDHKAFKINWIIKKIKAFFTSLFFNPSFQIRNIEIPIITYNIVQTGPKTLLGGLNDGLFKVAYHVGIESIVKIAPINPAS